MKNNQLNSSPLFLSLFTFIFIFAGASANAKVEYTFSQLLMKSSDQVRAIIKSKMDKAAESDTSLEDDQTNPVAETEAIAYLKDGVRIILSRPDQDGLRGPVFLSLRKELNNFGAFERIMKELTIEATDSLRQKSEEPKTQAVQATYVILLENLMSEIQPEIEKEKALRQIIEMIRDANIKISDSLKNKELLRTMRQPVSPSETAKKLLNALPKPKK